MTIMTCLHATFTLSYLFERIVAASVAKNNNFFVVDLFL